MKENHGKAFILIALLLSSILFLSSGVHRFRWLSTEKSNVSAFEQPDITMAIKLESAAVKSNPDNPVCQNNLGCLLAARDSINYSIFENAIIKLERIDTDIQMGYLVNCFERASELVPDEPVFALNKSVVLSLTGNMNMAFRVLEPFLDNENIMCECLCVAGLLKESIYDYEASSVFYSKALVNNPSIAGGVFFRNLEERNDSLSKKVLLEAKNTLEKRFQLTNDPVLASKLGIIEYYTGNYNYSENHLLEAIDKLPSLNRPWFYLGLIYESLSQKEEALNCFRKSYDLEYSDPLPLRKLVDYGDESQERLEVLEKVKISSSAYRLEAFYGSKSIKFPYVLMDLEQVCRP